MLACYGILQANLLQWKKERKGYTTVYSLHAMAHGSCGVRTVHDGQSSATGLIATGNYGLTSF